MNKVTIGSLALALLAVSACDSLGAREERILKDAGIGAAAGAVIGGVVGGNVEDAAKGAAVGGVLGGGYGVYQENRRD